MAFGRAFIASVAELVPFFPHRALEPISVLVECDGVECDLDVARKRAIRQRESVDFARIWLK